MDLIHDPLELPPSVAHWLEEYKRLLQAKKDLEEKIDIARAHVELALGDSTLGTVNGQPAIRFGYIEQSRFDQKKAKELLDPVLLSKCYTTQRIRRFEPVRETEA